MFFAKALLILHFKTREMMLDEKLIWVIFLFKMGQKWVIKQQEQLATSTAHLA